MRSNAIALALDAAASVLVVAFALFVYDRYVVQPALQVGVVDVADVYRTKEGEFTQALTRATSEETRQQALRLASDFARRLPRALEELPRECRCLVVLKTTVAGTPYRSVDLTPQLRQKLEAP